MREVFDRKHPIKDLKFFSTSIMNPYTDVAIPNNQYVGSKVLFCGSTKDPRRIAVEEELL